jgi:nucleotide-binding universal stress UspA family protein
MEVTMARKRIVVGADGSPASIGALRWAMEHASQIEAEVDVVTGYDIPITILVVPTYTEEDYARDARALLDHTVEQATAGGHADVTLNATLVQDKPARALAQAAEGAELLVVGGRGQGELPGMHLGAVASYCVHHAPCPVLVYRSSDTT